MSATPLGFWKLPADAQGRARHLAIVSAPEAAQTLLLLNDDGGWRRLAVFQDELAGRAAARAVDALLQSVTYLRMGGTDVLDGADTARPGVEWAGYEKDFEEDDLAQGREVDARARLWILPAVDGASVGLKLPGHARYDDAVAEFADVDAARAAVAAVDELVGAVRRR